MASSADERKIDNMTFNGMHIFSTIDSALKSSYFQVQIDEKTKFIHKETACWLLIDKASRLPADRLSRVIETIKEH
jgi:hypothetical protein